MSIVGRVSNGSPLGKECREIFTYIWQRSPSLFASLFVRLPPFFYLWAMLYMYRLGPIAYDRSFDYLDSFLSLLGECSLGNFNSCVGAERCGALLRWEEAIGQFIFKVLA